MNGMQEKIIDIKKQKNAVILAHYYQTIGIQQIADYVGDSLELARRAKDAKENLIIFCGVKFMAESAKLLAPDKKVMLPKMDAGCPMADMINPGIIKDLKKKHPGAAVVCYVNSTAETKAECDVCCTSANAADIVKNIDGDEIIFIPDKNLGAYAAGFVPEKKFIFVKDGGCPIHKNVTVKETKDKRREFPNAKLAVHPECAPEIVKLADFTGSTSKIIDYCVNSKETEFIIGTEEGVVDLLKFYHPEKTYHLLSAGLICADMKKTALGDVYDCLVNENIENIIELPEDIIKRARIPLEKMLAPKG